MSSIVAFQYTSEVKNIKQKYAIEFHMKLGKKDQKTAKMLNTTCGDEAIIRTTFYRWDNAFKDTQKAVEDEKREG